ncbi:amidohydrolase family protein [Gayadomonas joobiniege]|uniref:amidohydrolase family protein n=1 Tax=Gayadomonas joobiniege TaxID=1234606 RepID=UPI000377A58D|nr:amidohydrolase family protein [Gayadomonas joobiniege]
MKYLIKNADYIFSQPEKTDIRIDGSRIIQIGKNLLIKEGEQVIDAENTIIYPGFVNTHHHIAQSVIKGIPTGLNQNLSAWLASVPYTYWPHFTPELMYWAAKLGFYEQLRSGVTSCADHHYLYHKNTSQELEDAVWQAAAEVGIKLVLCRGGATVRGTHKGMQKNNIEPESIDLALKRIDDSRTRYHQTTADATQKIVVAPTTIMHSAKADDLKSFASYARNHKLRLHSHLLEVDFDEQTAQEKYQMSAVQFAQSVDWLGPDVWFAHLVKTTNSDINVLAQSGTGIAHCPTSNCRLGSGIAPLLKMRDAGMPISIGVDGSASAEAASMLQEINLTWLLHRAVGGANATHLQECVHWATESGAKMLGLDNVGRIEVGQQADLVLWDITHYRYQGIHEKAYAPIMAGEPAKIKMSFVNGIPVVKGGEPINLRYSELTQNLTEQIQLLKNRICA